MKIIGSDLWHKPLITLLPTTPQLLVLLLSALFTIEIFIMHILPNIVSNAPTTTIVEDLTAALILTTLCAPFLWRLIIGCKRTEKELSLAAKVFEHMGEAISVTDANNKYISVNPVFTRITGYGLEEIMGETPRIMTSGCHDIVFYQNMWESINESGYWQGEIWDRRKDGTVYPKWLSVVAVKDSREQLQNYIAVFSDISERKAADERIHFMAHYDALTGLPNRVLLHDRILQAITAASRFKKKVAILLSRSGQVQGY